MNPEQNTQTSTATGLNMPESVARAQLRADPDTQALAAAFEMDLEDYISVVLDFVRNPDKQPELTVCDDETLREMGERPATCEEISAWFEGVEQGEIPVGAAATGHAKKDSWKKEAVAERARAAAAAELAGTVGPRTTQRTTVDGRGEIKVVGQGGGHVLRDQVMQQRLRGQVGPSPSMMDARRRSQARRPPARGPAFSARGA